VTGPALGNPVDGAVASAQAWAASLLSVPSATRVRCTRAACVPEAGARTGRHIWLPRGRSLRDCRSRRGGAVLDAVRRSRCFFDLGPFRAQQLSRLAEGRYRLAETLSAAYYQPRPWRNADRTAGTPSRTRDGRFSAAMAFRDRPRDEITLATSIDVAVNSGDPLAGPGDVLGYDLGQDYTFLGGTDATTGTRLYLGGHTPQTLGVSLRA
jgi:hypothetical protein